MAVLAAQEQRYHGSFSGEKPVPEGKDYNGAIRSRARNQWIANSLTFATAYTFLSLIVALENIQDGISNPGVFVLFFSLFPVSVVMNSYSSASYSMYLKGSKTPKILNTLPVRRVWSIFEIVWFMNSGFLSVFLVLPVTILYCIESGAFYPLVMGIMMWLASALLGYSIGFAFGSESFSGVYSGSMSKKVANLLRNIVLLILFTVFFSAMYSLPRISETNYFRNNPGILISLQKFGSFISGNSSPRGSDLIPVALLACIVFGCLILSDISARYGTMGIFRVSRPSSSTYGTSHSRTRVSRSKGKILNSIRKDVNLWLRQSFTSLIMFTPVFLIFPVSVNYILGISRVDFQPLEFMIFILAGSMISSFTYSAGSIVSEGKGINVLHLLPVTVSDIVKMKLFSSTMVFAACLVPVYALAAFLSGIPLIESIIIFFTAISIFMISFLISSSLTYHKASRMEWKGNIQESVGYGYLSFSYILSSCPPILASVPVMALRIIMGISTYVELLLYASINLLVLILLYSHMIERKKIENNGFQSTSFAN